MVVCGTQAANGPRMKGDEQYETSSRYLSNVSLPSSFKRTKTNCDTVIEGCTNRIQANCLQKCGFSLQNWEFFQATGWSMGCAVQHRDSHLTPTTPLPRFGTCLVQNIQKVCCAALGDGGEELIQHTPQRPGLSNAIKLSAKKITVAVAGVRRSSCLTLAHKAYKARKPESLTETPVHMFVHYKASNEAQDPS